MIKRFFSLYILAALLLNSCATTSNGNSNMVISGRWLAEASTENRQAFIDFISNTKFRIIQYEDGKKVREFTEKYRIDGNEIILTSRRHKGMGNNFPMTFDLSLSDVLKIENFLYIFGTQIFYKFEVNPDEFTTMKQQDSIEIALENAAKRIMASMQQGRNVAISNVSAENKDNADFIANELEVILLDAGFVMVDRSQLDIIRQEQDLQLSGAVADNEIISIGKFAGANLVITGSIDGSGATRRLRIRVLDIETAQVITAASERF